MLALVLQAVVLCVIDPDAYSPLLPAPQQQENGSTVLIVEPASFIFRLGAKAATSEVLKAGTKHYHGVIFAWGNNSAPALRALSSTAPILREVDVEVQDAADATVQFGADESYELRVPNSGSAATLTALTVWGALRGLETLSQLIEYSGYGGGGGGGGGGIYELRSAPWAIADAPAFLHRGVMLDTARHFLPVATLLRAIDALAYNRMNVLHWHAVDADAFPLQLSAYDDELARRGAYLYPGATYSAAETAAVVAHGRMRGVRVVLELDLPGHATSWAQGALPPELFVPCSPGPNGDWGGHSSVLDVTSEASLAMVNEVMAEVAGRFPSGQLHLGGDEVDFGCLNASASMTAWRAEHPGCDVQDAHVLFELRLHERAAALGRNLTTWADVWLAVNASRGGNCSFFAGEQPLAELPAGAVAQVWGATPSVADVVRGSQASVVRSTGYYLSTGFSTGGRDVLWEDIYNDDPMPAGLTAEQQSRVLGAEAAMWGEVTDAYNLDSKLWFRASVLAERLWSSNATIAARNPAWPATYRSADITARLVKHRCRLLQRGIAAQPYNTQAVPDRSRWVQCETWLPPAVAPAQHRCGSQVLGQTVSP